MEVKQIYEIMNDVFKETLGETAIIQEDLGNLVDLGKSVFNANAVDNYCKNLVNRISKVVVVDRVYKGEHPSILMESWEFGSVIEKIDSETPESRENESWELENGTSYDPNIFYAPKVSVKFFNSLTTFEVDISITDKQLRESFLSVNQLNRFLNMISVKIENRFTIDLDNLIARTINNMIAETLHAEYGTDAFNSKSTIKAVNLLYLYNTKTGLSLTKDKALYDTDFLKFASYYINLYVGRLRKPSKLFNVGGAERFTNKDDLHVILLDEFVSSTETYLEADTYHNELVKLPMYEHTAYWQGSGTDFEFDSTSKISVKDTSGDVVTLDGIIGCMFDKYALGCSKLDRRTTSNYNGKAEFTNYFHKMDSGWFNDLNENMVVFFIQ